LREKEREKEREGEREQSSFCTANLENQSFKELSQSAEKKVFFKKER
jgi:hypothetical protein